ncbi:rsbT co-antagonist protein RsbR [Geomicrobium halophilum]|uniref:RsbT co-antagonist protein RsbR n=1 Tax=Geomicrobium halophilum TaxID=549000 RepID=A0A841Q271_9BACL|nr:hypothetical protein [Geomicrobium halophilum]MBB6450308.1 rsbT co-antagonist protein RsbR [Geomicrobium halophilum]
MGSRQITNRRTVPILKVTDNIGLLPLLVDINEMIIKDVLQQCSEETYAHLVIELSSIPSFNTDDLFKMMLGLEHIGVHTIMSGIRPEKAQKVNHDGKTPFDTHRSFPDLYQALISLDVPMKPREAEK